MPCLHSIVFLPDFNRMIIAQHFKNVTYIFCSKKSVLSYTKNTTSPNGFNTNWLLWDFGDLWSSSFGIFDLFWDLTICNQPIWRCIWLILEFLNLRSCIFWSFIDRIWGFTIYSHAFSAFCLTAFGVFCICGQIFPGFSWLHLAFSRFAVMHPPDFSWLHFHFSGFAVNLYLDFARPIWAFCHMQSIPAWYSKN